MYLCYGIPSPLFRRFDLYQVSPSSYLAGVIACLSQDSLGLSFRRHPASEQATNPSNYNFQASVKHLVWVPCVSDLSGARGTYPCIAVVGPQSRFNTGVDLVWVGDWVAFYQ